MKKGLSLFVLSVICTMTFAQSAKPQWNRVSSNNPETFKTQLISSSENSIKVNVQVPGFYTTTVTTPRGEANIISLPKSVSTAQAGEPNVPMTGIPVMIGDKARMDVRVIDAQYKDFEGIEVAPSKGDFSRQIDPETVPYTYGECYNQNSFFPASNLDLYEPYIIRDFRGQNMAVYPFAYNPVTKTLRVYYNMTVEMYKVDDKGNNVIENRRSNVVKMSQDFKSLYQRHFINYEAGMAKYTPVDDEGDLLIICYDSFLSSMTDFVNWKKTRGINTTIVGTSTVSSNLTYSNLKTYIQNQYNANNNLTHVLLVGDVDQIPGYVYTGASGYEGKGDNPYGQIVGNDIFNDVFIGRFSANNANQVTTQVNRTITYERDLTTSDTWCQDGLGVSKNEGGSGHNGEDDYEHMEIIRQDLLGFGYSTVYQDYAGASGYPSSSTTTISNHINAGVGIINYCNHGSQTEWQSHYYSNSHVNALTNDNKLPFIFSVACYNGQYDYSSDCFGEAWLHATNGSNPTGAIGGTFSYISQPWIPPMWAQDEFVDIITESYSNNIKHTFAGAAVNGMMGIFDNYSTTTAQAVGTYQAWIVYGDPSLTIRTKTPQAMTINHEGVMPVGSPSYQITVSNGEGAVATITDADHNILGKATVTNGMANIQVSGTPNPGDELTLCVFGYNKVTSLSTVTVIALEGPYIIADSYTPTEAHVGDNTDLSITFKNMGLDATTGNTTVTLSSDDNNVTLIDYTGSFASLAADATTTVSGFSFQIAEGVADGTPVTLHYAAVNGNETWEGNLVIIAGEAVLEYQNMAWNGGFTPGETLTLTAKFKNNGHYQATNAMATLTSSSNYIIINNSPITVGTIAMDEEVSCQFEVTIPDNCPETAVIPVTFTLTADGGLSAEGNETLKNSCNVIFNLADSYGDGWNGASLVVSFNDGTPSQSLTFSSGSSASYTLEVGNGTHVTLTWNSGSYDGECTFTVSYEGDLTIFSQSSRPTAGVLYEFDCNCAAASQTFMVNVTSSNTNYGTVSGGGEFSFGQSCTVTATPAAGYMFTGWTMNGELVSSVVSYTFNVTCDMDLMANFDEGIMIGDGSSTTNSYLPSYSLYNYSLTQQIYTAEEIGLACTITGIAFYNTGSDKTRNYDMYLVHTNKSTFSSGTDWITVTAADKVFSGTITMTSGEWTFFILDTPFEYNGTSNLAIIMDDNTGSWQSGMTCLAYSATNQSIRVYNDNTNYNPISPSSYSGTLESTKNQILLTISAGQSFTLDINGYGDNTNSGYYLLASPIDGVNPAEVGMVADVEEEYDLYYFDQSAAQEWINYKPTPHFNLEIGKGYLYASKNNTTLTFNGMPYEDNVFDVQLHNDESANLSGWNLVGNPFTVPAYIDRDFYEMNDNGSGVIVSTPNSIIDAMEGIFVLTDDEGEWMMFSTEPNDKGSVLAINLCQGRLVIDRAVLRFGESSTLPKFQLFENSTKLYIPQGNNDYAVVSSEGTGEMPLNFEAQKNGVYTLSIVADNVEFSYLHLIDNMTGADIDLLETPSYTFEANTSDYASRFKLVFATGNTNESSDFAYISDGNIIVNGEGTLQVIDMTGRVISTEQINGMARVNMNAAVGVYVLQLTNGNDVKTQKIVVK